MLHKVTKNHKKFVSDTFVIAVCVTSATLWSQAYTHTPHTVYACTCCVYALCNLGMGEILEHPVGSFVSSIFEYKYYL